jgi:hypothetical protein
MPRSKRNRLASLLALASVLAALGVAGCGGGTTSHTKAASGTAITTTPTTSRSPVTTPSQSAPSPATTGIPQGNGGDQDADNNGGPSDGDGEI